jgi:Tol biopolymer transport system component
MLVRSGRSIPVVGLSVLAAAAAGATWSGPASGTDSAAAKVTALVSVSSAEAQGNGVSEKAAISATGRYVAFVSSATNLVPGDTNGVADVFVRDRATGVTRRVSVNSRERQGNATSGVTTPSVSADGRYVVFTSKATNLVRGDTNHRQDVFLRDRVKGTTQRVSVSSTERQGNARSGEDGAPSITADGHFIVFTSRASNLVADDTNERVDVFVRNRKAGTTVRVSVGAHRAEANGESFDPTISADGQVVAFASVATNLIGADTNKRWDVFVRDRERRITRRISVSDGHVQGNNDSSSPRISDDGRYVAFTSWASNLVRGDTNRRLDVFLRDRTAATTSRVSVSTAGAQANGSSLAPAISGNGRYVTFESAAANLIADDTNGHRDVFVRDRVAGTTHHVSVATDGTHGNGDSRAPAITRGGTLIVFTSTATNLVTGDVNGKADVFLRYLPQ